MAWYRKYRSQNFDAVIGQPQVVTTLRSAIAADRLSHAYLFTGPRGTGKTSVARLLARAANCTATDPAARPCGTCDNCKVEIGSHLDLIEIDAASNRGIDDARALRDKITSAPSMGRYKVYIIDEAHMLTTEAFNALLKTLEEPPPHAIFVLATTEAHKLPETIVSRTQSFRFRPIDRASMIDHLREIAAKEKVTIDDEALALIAQMSRGGFRDAISMLDQIAQGGNQAVDVATVRQLLGQTDPELVRRIMQAVEAQDGKAVLMALDEAYGEAAQPGQLAAQLIEAYRRQIREALAEGGDAVAQVAVAVQAVELLLPVLKSSWAQLALEAALLRLAHGLYGGGETGGRRGAVRAASKPAREQTSASSGATDQGKKTSHTVSAGERPAPPARAAGNDELWMKALTYIKQRNNSLYALLRSSCTVEFRDNNEVILACRFGFHRDRLKESKNKTVIEQALAKVYGHKFTVLPQLETRPAAQPVAAAQPEAELMASALEILGGEVVS